ncbi:hypothetical protein GXP67_19615 [Rhodocytophaga rosea]|uniref:Uncharacterized protein n=1 Tax=Rhodocytophaga rosea TaxID=2704465 RepID=A0A6C0GLK4_9BACT|nr:hypothetical protein [Rhodocytophaga rosea]QHT68694.1 hypothetical protein GXP67_19615 [Rhodocytophaga rosea]
MENNYIISTHIAQFKITLSESYPIIINRFNYVVSASDYQNAIAEHVLNLETPCNEEIDILVFSNDSLSSFTIINHLSAQITVQKIYDKNVDCEEVNRVLQFRQFINSLNFGY